MNLLLIAAAVVLIINIIMGAKNGMVKSVVSLLTTVITCIVIALIAGGVGQYAKGHVLNVIVVVVLLAIIGVVQLLLKPIFFSAKMIAKLPIVSWVDTLLGILFGLIETILILWLLYYFVITLELGAIGEQALQYTRDNSILKWFFEHNYLADFLQGISQKLGFMRRK